MLAANADEQKTKLFLLLICVDDSTWGEFRKLGCLLGFEQGVARRIQLPDVPFGILEAA
jgi:hypothetical protein